MKLLKLLIILSLLVCPGAFAQSVSRTSVGQPPPDNTAYNATSWNGSLRSATKNAIRDQIESILSGAAFGDDITFTSATSAKPLITIQNTNADANSGILRFDKQLAGDAADSDVLGELDFYGLDAGDNATRYALIDVYSADVTDGDESGEIDIGITMDGTVRSFLDMTGYNGSVGEGYIEFNQAQQDVDFIVNCNGAECFNIEGSSGNVTITAGKKIYLDGGGNSYIQEDTSDRIGITAGGSRIMHFYENIYVETQRYAKDATHGGYIERVYYATTGTFTAAASINIPLAIPAGWVIEGCQLHVKTALAGGETWDADLDDGAPEESICTNQAVAVDTNVNHHAHADPGYGGTLTDAETDIEITKNGGGAFSAQGEIEAHCIARGFDTWDNE